MTTDSYDLDTVEEAFDVTLKIDLTLTKLANAKAWCSKCEGYGHYDYQCSSKSRRVSIVPSDDVEDSNVVEDVRGLSKTTSIIEDVIVGFDAPIIDEGHASYKGTSEVVDAIVESSTPTVDAYVHDTSDSALELVEFSVSSQIFRYSATPLIEDETVDSNVITSSGPSESLCVDYGFMVIPTESFFIESLEFLAMIQQVVSGAFLLVV